MEDHAGTPDSESLGSGRVPSDGIRPGRPEASAVIWRWREPAPAPGAAHAALRREGVIRGLVGGAVGLGLFLFHHPRIAAVAWAVSGLVLLAVLLSPAGLYARIGRGLAGFGVGVGRVLGALLLTPVFFLVFALFGRLLRRGRRDKLERWFEPAAGSYWKRREDGERTRAYYEHQF